MPAGVDLVELVLPERFAPSEDDAFLVQMQQSQDAAVRISARRLRQPDTLLLQYLVSAARFWRARGLRFEVVEMSEPMQRELEKLGFAPEMFRGVVIQ